MSSRCCWWWAVVAVIAASSTAAADPVVSAQMAATGDEADPIRPSEVFICRKCGAIIARGQEYLPDSPEAKRLLAEAMAPELGANGKVFEFEQPGSAESKEIALFKQSEPTVKAVGKPSSYESWFPGYSWRPAQCGHCGEHVGWQFDNVNLLTRQRMASVGASGSSAGEHLPNGALNPSAAPSSPGRPLSRSQRAREFSAAAEEMVFAPLNGKCTELTQGFWTYEVCHGREVRQFHIDMQAKAKAQQLRSQGKLTPKVPRSPDWSLGKFDQSNTQQRLVPPPGAGVRYFTSHFFKNGQRCDETSTNRKTEVQYLCCGGADNAIINVEEPAQCKYRIQVCLQRACGGADSTKAAQAQAEARRRQHQLAAEAARQAAQAKALAQAQAQAQGGKEEQASFFAAYWPAVAGDRGEALAWLEGAAGFTGPA